jgi:hypothetical protein
VYHTQELLTVGVKLKIIPVYLCCTENVHNNSLSSRWMDLGEVGWGDVDWIGLAQDRNSGELL